MTNNKLLCFGLLFMITATLISIISHVSAQAQTAADTQLYPNPQQFLAPPPGQAPLPQTVIDSAKMIELGHFYHILGAFAQACVQAYQNQDTNTLRTCVEVSTTLHDYLVPFLNSYNDTITKVIDQP